jgi:F-type H+-transporting ATPase subunit epsilon
MNISVLTPDRSVFTGEISSVKVPGTKGSFEVLKNHAPIVSSLAAGEVRLILSSGERMTFTISAGFIEVLNNQVSLLVQGYSAKA